ncbi:hypothetical protein [Nonomuraea sp. NPDC003709]|uniref:hypothetical protein n=1 Tax=Nonomuraea sp. NPDC003709 TaxID=3154450 RepID=UPI0033A3186A
MIQGGLQVGCLLCQDIDDFVEVAVGARSGQAEAASEVGDVAAVAEPHQPEDGLPPGGLLASALAGAALAALVAQELGKIGNQLPRDVEDGTIANHVESFDGDRM